MALLKSFVPACDPCVSLISSRPHCNFFDVSAKISAACRRAIGDGFRRSPFSIGLFQLEIAAAPGFPSCQSQIVRPLTMDVNGDTASLKRKREPKDEPALSQKKHRRKSKPQEANVNGEDATNGAVQQRPDSDVELSDASSHSLAGPIQNKPQSWRLSKPMGGRMLDIDPIFSPDER